MPGFLFEQVVYDAQSVFPDVYFILLDGTPHNEDFTDFLIEENTVAINYYEQEIGFIAGYQAYQMGYERSAFIGGMPVPMVLRYGVGFVAGLYYAAYEDGNYTYGYDADDIHFTGTFAPSFAIVSRSLSYYNDGVEAIFAVAGGAVQSVIDAAESLEEKMVIACDTDLSMLSDKIVFSAIKNLTMSTFLLLDTYYTDAFPGSNHITHGVNELAIDLVFPTDSTEDLTGLINLYAELVLGNIPIPSEAHELLIFITDYLPFSEPIGLLEALTIS